MTIIKPKEPCPLLDLRTIADQSEHKEAITGFIEKNLDHSSVIIVGTDGVTRWVSIQPGKSDWAIKELTTYATSEDEITVTDPSNVVRTFLELTAFTVPYGYEYEMYHTMLTKLNFVMNGRNNYWITVGDGTSKTLFVAHLDTYGNGKPVKVNHLVTDDNFVKTDLTTLLGADNKAGLAVLLYLISQNVAGDYLLVVGEEQGCIGSGQEASHIVKGKYDRAIQFDRAGTSEIITHQMGQRTASREFARALAKEFRTSSNGIIQLIPSDRGVYTDTKEFTNVIKECTNISIGYTGQHTVLESQDLSFLVTIAKAAATVRWEKLPTRNSYSQPNNFSKWGFIEHTDDDEPWGDDDEFELSKKSMWEIWASVDNGNLDIIDIRTWVIHNPTMAGKIIVDYISNYPTESLDTLTKIEMEA